jgi:putative phosphoribosyl transferase
MQTSIQKGTSIDSASVEITAGHAALPGDLSLPRNATGLVIFAHGSGSSRWSPRNRQVAETLNAAGLGTLLFDLLTPEEAFIDNQTGEMRFDIGLLSERITAVVDWLGEQETTAAMPLGLFGASTGAAAALNGAAARPGRVSALVSRGGRPDLAVEALPQVQCPVLLIVGGNDTEVLELNRQAAERIPAPHALEVISGATHLFEEPGTLDEVARLAADWFRRHFSEG